VRKLFEEPSYIKPKYAGIVSVHLVLREVTRNMNWCCLYAKGTEVK